MNIEDLIKNNERLIYKIASSFYGVEKEDLYQAGCLGLQKAYLNYQKDGKAKFSTYAHDYIFGEMYNLASKKILKINRETLLLYKKIEKAEIKMQKVVIDNLLFKNNLNEANISLIVGGDLINQISVTSYAMRDYNISHLGIYSACATFPESLIIGSMYLQNSGGNVIAISSSHNLTAERQFRYPVEYGAPKPHTATFTSTGAIGTLLGLEKSKIRIESATIGKVIDMGINDTSNFGAAMAPAAADTLYNHLQDLKRNIDYYDLILTGDLGSVGLNIFKEYLKKAYNLKIKNNLDAGCELYLKSQDTYAGGSGPACLPLVLFSKILLNPKYHKILIVGTGALHSPMLINQHNTIPAIAHAVSLEVK